MTAPSQPSVRELALAAAVRHHFESLHRTGLCIPFDEIGERSRRIVRQQMTGVVTAVLSAVASSQAFELVGRGLANENGYTAAEWDDPENGSMRADHLYDAHAILTGGDHGEVAPSVTSTAAYDRAVLVEVLVYHYRRDERSCGLRLGRTRPLAPGARRHRVRAVGRSARREPGVTAAPSSSSVPALSRRQLDVLRLAAQGLSISESAEVLFMGCGHGEELPGAGVRPARCTQRRACRRARHRRWADDGLRSEAVTARDVRACVVIAAGAVCAACLLLDLRECRAAARPRPSGRTS